MQTRIVIKSIFLALLFYSVSAQALQEKDGFTRFESGDKMPNDAVLFKASSGLDSVPTPEKRYAPVYPIQQRLNGYGGMVTINFTVNADGSVGNLSAVSGSSTPPHQQHNIPQSNLDDATRLFESQTMDGMGGWKYKPAMKDGQAVAVHARITWKFRTAPYNPDAVGECWAGDLEILD